MFEYAHTVRADTVTGSVTAELDRRVPMEELTRAFVCVNALKRKCSSTSDDVRYNKLAEL